MYILPPIGFPNVPNVNSLLFQLDYGFFGCLDLSNATTAVNGTSGLSQSSTLAVRPCLDIDPTADSVPAAVANQIFRFNDDGKTLVHDLTGLCLACSDADDDWIDDGSDGDGQTIVRPTLRDCDRAVDESDLSSYPATFSASYPQEGLPVIRGQVIVNGTVYLLLHASYGLVFDNYPTDEWVLNTTTSIPSQVTSATTPVPGNYTGNFTVKSLLPSPSTENAVDAMGPPAGTCLTAKQGNETAKWGVEMGTCEYGRDGQVFRFEDGTGRIQHVGSGMCLDVGVKMQYKTATLENLNLNACTDIPQNQSITYISTGLYAGSLQYAPGTFPNKYCLDSTVASESDPEIKFSDCDFGVPNLSWKLQEF
ncbi:hypothetical protein HK101_011219 [Irineochytrium annulatum]|nr:hypothetical protein HK101_011219 [Irineochytrium annulatum]